MVVVVMGVMAGMRAFNILCPISLMRIEMMNRFKRVVAVGLVLVGSICSPNSFGDAYSEYSNWRAPYNMLGIHPTHAEIRAECKTLGFNDAQVDFYIATENGAEVREMINAYIQVRAEDLDIATKATESRSRTTVKMAERVLALLDEVKAEKNSRNVKKFLITHKKLEELMNILPIRVDSEGTIEDIRITIGKMNSANAPLAGERAEFIKEINVYNERTKREDFDTKKYVQDLTDRFNEYTHRVNAKMYQM